MVYFSDFTQPQLRELQLRLCEILDWFDEVCKKYGLMYYLAGGTCLGAVRHHGFIPWDDDLDVAMPRKDYEKFWELGQRGMLGNRYVAVRPTQHQNTGFHIMQVRDSMSTCIYTHSVDLDICHGIKIDIDAIDGCPSDKKGRIIQWFWLNVHGLYSAQRIPNQASKKKKMLARVLLKIVPSKIIRSKIWTYAERQYSKYDYDKCVFVRDAGDKYWDKSVWGEPVYMKFEGKKRPIPAKYDEYLRGYYGDYMQFPPEELRRPETVVAFYDLNKSYVNYKGIEYLKNEI